MDQVKDAWFSTVWTRLSTQAREDKLLEAHNFDEKGELLWSWQAELCGYVVRTYKTASISILI